MKRTIKNITIRTAKESSFDTFRHGAVIEKGGRVFVSGVNTPKPRTPNSSFSTHAEIWALKRLMTILTRQRKKEKFELYVARVAPRDNIALSFPCSKCMKALKDSGVIDVVHYTTNGSWESIRI
jgi:tRNA(Arg) A34 adenosine deaminase TadA